MRLEDSPGVAKSNVDKVLLGDCLNDIRTWQDHYGVRVIQRKQLIAVLVTYMVCNEIAVREADTATLFKRVHHVQREGVIARTNI